MSSEELETPDSSNTIFMSGPEGLARMLELDEPGKALWDSDETRAIWRHQLQAPLDADLSTLDSAHAAEIRSLAEMQPFLNKSFGEFLQDTHPPIGLLKLIKEFAKRTLNDSEDAQLKAVATALYYGSYAAGLTRCGTRIGTQDNEELERGFKWGLKQTWLDEGTKELMTGALELVSAKSG
jgi:hypothetical protein